MEIIMFAFVVLIVLYLSKSSDVSSLEKTLATTKAELSDLNAKIDTADKYYDKRKTESDRYYTERMAIFKQYYNSEMQAINNAKAKLNKDYEQITAKKELAQKYIDAKIRDYPILTLILADYEIIPDLSDLEHIATKRNPARYDTVSKFRKMIMGEHRSLIAQNKALKWELQYLHTLFPWLEELEDMPMEAKPDYTNPNYNVNDDAAGFWLTPEEYNSLSQTEKYQRALDRYKRRHKSKAEIGRDYERYIGYLYEKAGYSVQYYGIQKGLEDLGRDLICRRGNEIHVVQCKCWSKLKGKVIHEKYINQHFGTTIKYFLDLKRDHPNDSFAYLSADDLFTIRIIPVFKSTVPYSEEALSFANVLGVKCDQVDLNDYPLIKCNIGKNGEKIYHLPFDQQYDNCIITPETGEFYAMTVQEAEDRGFRRAKRWMGNIDNTTS